MSVGGRIGIAVAAALGAAALFAPGVDAAPIDNPWEAGAYVVSSRYDNDSTLSDTFAGGVRGAWRFKPRHLAELTFEMQHTSSNNAGSSTQFDITKWTLNYLHDLTLKKPETKVTPLLLFGIGRMTYDDGTASDGTTLFQAGGGIRIRMNPRFALRFDSKIFHFHGDTQGMIPTHGFYGFDLDVGVSFLLGTAKK